MWKIAVDLTPLTDKSGIGGAKMLAVEMIAAFGREDAIFNYILLTCADTHDQLAWLDAANVQRICVNEGGKEKGGSKLQQQAHLLINSVFSSKTQIKINTLYRKVVPVSGRKNLLRELGVNLLLCPFTGPLFHTPGIPTVSVVLDLQFLVYPENFSKYNLMYLREHYRDACEFSQKLITISNFVKTTILENSQRSVEEITVIYPSIHDRLYAEKADPARFFELTGLEENEYLIYPAKFWPHKNHSNALHAFRLFLDRDPMRKTKLVFSGIADDEKKVLNTLVNQFDLAGHVVIFGWIEEEELASLLQSSWALFFPSIYEGFGIPIIEGFHFKKPVLCSNVTSLPEVAGDAALYFDPMDVEDMAGVIAEFADHPEKAAEMVEKGLVQLKKFSDSQGMAAAYEAVFSEVLSAP